VSCAAELKAALDKISDLFLQLEQVCCGGKTDGRRPTCLVCWLLFGFLSVGTLSVGAVFSLHLWSQRSEEVSYRYLRQCFWVPRDADPLRLDLFRSPARLKTILNCPNSLDSQNLEDQVPVFNSSSNSVAQIYPRALGSLFCRLLLQGGLRCRYSRPPAHRNWKEVKVKVMLRQTVSQSECLGVKFTLGLVTRYYFLSKICYVVSLGRPLWR
jgi:hypothetical protein